MKFRGKYGFLSNFYPSEIKLQMFNSEYIFPSAENAFQAQKVLFCNKGNENNIKTALQNFERLTPLQAKHYGKAIPLDIDKWNENKDSKMEMIIHEKFLQNPVLKDLLLEIDEHIEEENDWGDIYWGTCNGNGLNKLGTIIENERKHIISLDKENKKNFISVSINGDVCETKQRMIFEEGSTVYNYTEIVSENYDGKRIEITRWDKQDENSFDRVEFTDTQNNIFTKPLSLDKVKDIFERHFSAEIDFSIEKEKDFS